MTKRLTNKSGLPTFESIGKELGMTALETERTYKKAIYKLKKTVPVSMIELVEEQERLKPKGRLDID